MKKNVSVSFVDSSVDHLLSFRRRSYMNYTIRVNLLLFLPASFILLLTPNLILKFLFALIWFMFVLLFFDHRDIYHFDKSIHVWFGVPGSGKTSMAALLTRFSSKCKIPVLSNVQIAGSLKYDVSDLGKYDMSFEGLGAHVILDEATLYVDNRNYKDFAKTNLPLYFSMHRHMDNRIDIFSQGYDVDKRIRDRASSSGLFHLKKFPIPGILFYQRIRRILFIKKDDKQLIDGFQYAGLPKFIWSKSVWKSFDTLDRSLCPKDHKEFKPW